MNRFSDPTLQAIEDTMRYRCNKCHAPMLAADGSGACACGGLIESHPDNFKGEPSIYQSMVALGVEISSHATDLYVPVTAETTAIVRGYEFRSNVTTFRSEIDGKAWFDIPFAYEPAWPKAGEKWT